MQGVGWGEGKMGWGKGKRGKGGVANAHVSEANPLTTITKYAAPNPGALRA